MALRCINCNKGVMYGHNVSHAKNRTKRKFRPNLHAAKIQIGTISRRVRLCTKCLRMYKRSKQEMAKVLETSASQTTPALV